MICWIRPFTGLAGDMLLAALIDAGAALPQIRAAVAATGLTGWELTAHPLVTHGLAATRVDVHVTDHETRRSAATLLEMAARARPAPVAERAVAALTAIAEAEAHLHGTHIADVHLHELGGHDTLVDIVGVSAALHDLGVTKVLSAPLPLGHGIVRCAHGLIPAPAPATLALLTGAAVTGTDLTGETVTPTGAALLRAAGARYEPPPPMTLASTGYGAGTRRLPDRPNVTAVTLGNPADRSGIDAGEPAGEVREEVVVLETNLDDVTGETLAHTIARLLDEGALDAWATPAVMKKGRPAHVLHVLARPRTAGRLQRLVFEETGSLGVREVVAARTALPRAMATVQVEGRPVRIKTGPHRAKPEYDDVAAAAAQLGLPLHAVAERALAAFRGTRARTDQPEDGHDHR
jgi:uncharacterized protein (TIGR00299 family) protein